MKKNNFWRYAVFGAFLTTLSFSCRSSPTGTHITEKVQLSAEYVTCTEVWLKVGFTDSPNGGNFAINRDGNTVLMGHFSGADTTVIDTTVLPEKTYNYVCWRMVNGLPKNSSSNLQVQTMDTSGNNFTWQTFTFGGNAGGCLLKDVAIINDTDIWAVGEIAVKDSSANGYTVYNLTKWNGTSWESERVPYNYQGEAFYGPIYAILPFGAEDVWLGVGNLIHWFKNQFNAVQVGSALSGSIMRMWGVASNDFYLVAKGGSAAQYDGQSFQGISTSTSLDLHDIWGVTGSITGQPEVLAVASDQFTLRAGPR